MSIQRRRWIRFPSRVAVALLAVVAIVAPACGGGDSKAPVLSGPAVLSYLTFQSGDTLEHSVSRLNAKPVDGPSRVVREYPGKPLFLMLGSPDGRYIAITDAGVITIVDREGNEYMRLGETPLQQTGAGPFAAWSADGTKFAYSRVSYSATPDANITKEVARSGWIEIVDVPSKSIITPAWLKKSPLSQPSWSPDGKSFVAVDFGEIGSVDRPLVIGGMDARRRLLTRTPIGNKATPLWSPDGKRVAYWVIEPQKDDQGRDLATAIFVVGQDGKNAKLLTEASFLAPQAWSPDSKSLAITCPAEGKSLRDRVIGVCTVDVSSGKLTRLTQGPQDFAASFAPDGTTIAYLTDRDPTTTTFTLKTVRISDGTIETVATGVPFGGMTWLPPVAPEGSPTAQP